MPKVVKGNKQLTVEESKVGEFLQLGYSQIDEEGNIIKAGTATSLKELKEENDTLKAELAKYQEAKEQLENIVAIQEENATLKTENASLKEQLEAAAKKSK